MICLKDFEGNVKVIGICNQQYIHILNGEQMEKEAYYEVVILDEQNG